MTWLTWRQLRVQAVAVYAVVLAVVVVLAVTGPRIADLASGVSIYDLLSRNDRRLYYTGIVLLAVAPQVIGIFWGAPLVARELESGTHRLVWNQSVTRSRWLASRLGGAVLLAAAAVGALSLAVTWWASPLDGSQSSTQGSLPSRVTPVSFAMRGIVPVGYVVFALALATATGLVLRRTLPAMAVTLALIVAAQVAVPLFVRPHLVTPYEKSVGYSREHVTGIRGGPDGRAEEVSVNAGAAGSWIISEQTVDAHGGASGLPTWFVECLPKPPPPRAPQVVRVPAESIDQCFARLDAAGYRQHVVYQPPSRFWALQRAETAFYLVLSGLLAAFCFWRIRRVS